MNITVVKNKNKNIRIKKLRERLDNPLPGTIYNINFGKINF